MSTPARLGVAAVALALFAAAMWFAWLGWDDDYYEVDGVLQGPYRTWQVVGCGISLCIAAVAARVWAGRGAVLLAGAATVGFAIPWGVYAASTDDSGLWAVGLVMLLAGSFIGLVVLLRVSEAVLRRVGRSGEGSRWLRGAARARRPRGAPRRRPSRRAG